MLGAKVLKRVTGVWLAALVGMLCLVLGGLVTIYVGNLVRDSVISKHKSAAVATLSARRAQLEGIFISTDAVAKSIISFVRLNPDVSEDEYRDFAEEVMRHHLAIRIIALAPDNIIRYMHPLEGNQKAIGLDYTKNEQQWPAIKRAIDTRSVMMSGPIDLVQGGRGLIARIPIFLPSSPGALDEDGALWGVGAIVVDETRMLAAAGMERLADNYYFALKGAPEPGASPKPIFGNQNLFGMDSVFLQVTFPGAETWELAAYPLEGWNRSSLEVLMAFGLGYVFSAVIAVLAFLLVLENFKIRQMALHDPLTGLPNRRLLEDRMEQLAAYTDRSGMGFQIFFVDLNKFKPVNDRFGHATGDLLLNEIGRRLGEETRKSDTVARIGGDEFVVLTPGAMKREATEIFMSRLADRVREPFKVGGVEVGVEASVGQAVYPQDASTIQDLLKVADTRMYADKSGGDPRPAPAH